MMREHTYEFWPGTREQNVALKAYCRKLADYAYENDLVLNKMFESIRESQELRQMKRHHSMYQMSLGFPLLSFYDPWWVVEAIESLMTIFVYFEIDYPEPPELIRDFFKDPE